MKTDIFKLPSGAEIEFRQVMLAEENQIATALKGNAKKRGSVIDDVLSSCVIGVVDPGPYDFLTIGCKPNWDKMASGDKYFSLFKLRCLSYTDGNLFEFPVRCQDPECRKKITYEINLDTDLQVEYLSDESKEKIKNGEPFEMIIDDKKVTFGIMTGETEAKYKKLCKQHPERESAAIMRSRIIDVEGLERGQIMDWLDGDNGRSKTFTGLTSDNAEEIRAAFEYVDCGVDPDIIIECSECGEDIEVKVPFMNILMPGRRIKEQKKKRRLQRQ